MKKKRDSLAVNLARQILDKQLPLVLTVAEFAVRLHEKGHNLQYILIEVRKLYEGKQS